MKIKKTEGGQGGKRGHSNMCHWDYTEEIKREANRTRRRQGKQEVKEAIRDNDSKRIL